MSSKYLDHWARNCPMCIWRHYKGNKRQNLPIGIHFGADKLVEFQRTTKDFQWPWLYCPEGALRPEIRGAGPHRRPTRPAHCRRRPGNFVVFGVCLPMNWHIPRLKTCLVLIGRSPGEYLSLKLQRLYESPIIIRGLSNNAVARKHDSFLLSAEGLLINTLDGQKGTMFC